MPPLFLLPQKVRRAINGLMKTNPVTHEPSPTAKAPTCFWWVHAFYSLCSFSRHPPKRPFCYHDNAWQAQLKKEGPVFGWLFEGIIHHHGDAVPQRGALGELTGAGHIVLALQNQTERESTYFLLCIPFTPWAMEWYRLLWRQVSSVQLVLSGHTLTYLPRYF